MFAGAFAAVTARSIHLRNVWAERAWTCGYPERFSASFRKRIASGWAHHHRWLTKRDRFKSSYAIVRETNDGQVFDRALNLKSVGIQ
jgi:hypothetical protein